jgi:hypothetical protein
VARVIVDDALADARQLVADDKAAPTGDTLTDQIARRYHAALWEHKKARAREEASKTLGDMMRRQGKEKTT